ncbi:hypothetical protein WA026_004809 [Henosepilachna vigintioctopunctata]|uniref:Uncharacterized protein n=1 Tax=Henosepilachna vigintioctopunctata TaxID=420089 RepID=A0AAW1USP7_9CUCU
MKTEELSFYDGDNPNSQDSGYGTTYNPTLGRFVSYASPSKSSRISVGSLGSQEDDFLESMSNFEPIDENLPVNFKTLINGELSAMTETVNCRLSPQEDSIIPLFRRALSLQVVRSCVFKGEDIRSLKRPEPSSESETSPFRIKRSKIMDADNLCARPILKRAFSAAEESIKCAVQRSAEEELIGDFSRTYSLPLTQGRHQDLKSITSHTLARLMKGEFDDVVASYKVIDCR